MKKLRKITVLMLIVAVVSFALTGCSNESKHPSGDHPTSEHPTSEHPSKEAASKEHPTSEHPSKETTSEEHPTGGEHPK